LLERNLDGLWRRLSRLADDCLQFCGRLLWQMGLLNFRCWCLLLLLDLRLAMAMFLLHERRLFVIIARSAVRENTQNRVANLIGLLGENLRRL
jgi:hypothetical protein